MIQGRIKTTVAASLLLLNVASTTPTDPDNPTCPKFMNWSTYPEMKFSLETINGVRVLKAKGQIDQDVPTKLQDALKANQPIQEIWISIARRRCACRQCSGQDYPRFRWYRPGSPMAGPASRRAISSSWAA